MDYPSVLIYTVCSICYLPKALVLSKSVYQNSKNQVIIYLVDKKNSIVQDYPWAQIRWIEDENIPDLYNLAFKYDVTEFSTCIKPLLALRLLELSSKVIFLDPDICVYSSLDDIKNELDHYPILLTPHYSTPIELREENYDLAMMRFGSFNLGFFAVSSEPEAKEFLSWWSERCIHLGFFESQFGLSVDQKWVSIAPCFFPNLKIIFNPGYNVAFWNLHERVIEKSDQGYIVNGESELVFFHFSSFDEKNPRKVSKRAHGWVYSGRNDVDEICDNYAARLAENNNGYTNILYGFDYMNNGWYISPTLRRAYAAVQDDFNCIDPFDSNGPMLDFIQINHLREKRNIPYSPAGTIDIPRHRRKFKYVNRGLRFLLKILGPNSFSNLSRLFVYVSSFRQNRELWKIPSAH
jgi:hypothetical protein